MMSEKAENKKVASWDELNSNMLILAYIGFDKKYQPMDKSTYEWVKINFKGARSIVMRGGKKLNTYVSGLQAGDILLGIFHFPPELKKLTISNDQLKQALKKRGFNKFQVSENESKQSVKQQKRLLQIEKATLFIDKVDETVKTRNEATQAVEDLMDSTRRGKINIKELQRFVDHFAENASSEAISAIASLQQSDQTYSHCIDVGAIFHMIYNSLVEKKKIKSLFENESEILMSGFLHDFGKSKIPKDILDSTKLFEKNGKERQIMRKHPELSAKLLSKMLVPDFMINMSLYHHVKLDTSLDSSYPEVGSYDKLLMETRLLAIIDIYQALIGRRSYKKSWAPPAAIKFIEQLAGFEHDPDVWTLFFQIIGPYPAGSLVELNDGSLAFVINVSDTDLERPQVVVVRNSQGDDLQHNHFIDLQEERDVSIVNGLDNYEIFGDRSLEIFSSLQIS